MHGLSASRLRHSIRTPTAAKANGLASAFDPLVADLLALFMKFKCYRWQLRDAAASSRRFFFAELERETLEIADRIADHAAAFGPTAMRSMRTVVRLQSLIDEDGANVAFDEMLENLRLDTASVVAHLHAVHALCEECGAPESSRVLQGAVDTMLGYEERFVAAPFEGPR